LQRLVLFNAGVAALGLAVADDPGNIPRLTFGAYAGAAFAGVILHGINDLSQRTPLSTLRRHRARLESGVPLSSAELDQIERDFIATEPLIGKRLSTLPVCVGAPVAFAPAFSNDYSEGEKNWSLVGGSLLGLICVLGMSVPALVDSYERNLEASGVKLRAGPASIETVYRF
jgi:hypothetical protein